MCRYVDLAIEPKIGDMDANEIIGDSLLICTTNTSKTSLREGCLSLSRTHQTDKFHFNHFDTEIIWCPWVCCFPTTIAHHSNASGIELAQLRANAGKKPTNWAYADAKTIENQLKACKTNNNEMRVQLE